MTDPTIPTCPRCGAVVTAERSDMNIAPDLDYVAVCHPCPEADETSIQEYGRTREAALERFADRARDEAADAVDAAEFAEEVARG